MQNTNIHQQRKSWQFSSDFKTDESVGVGELPRVKSLAPDSFIFFALGLPALLGVSLQNPAQPPASTFISLLVLQVVSDPYKPEETETQTTLFLATFQLLTPNVPCFSLICKGDLKGLPCELLVSGSTGRRSSALGPALSWGCWLCHVDARVGVSTGSWGEGGGRAIRSKVPPKP